MNALLNILVLFLVRIVIPVTLVLLVGEKVQRNQQDTHSQVF